MVIDARKLVGATAVVLAVAAGIWLSTSEPEPIATVEISSADRSWSVEVTDVQP